MSESRSWLAPGNYAYLPATTHTGHYSTSKTTLINPAKTPSMVQVEYNREKGAMDKYAVDARGNRDDRYATALSGIDNAKFYSNTQHWEAMSYPEFKESIVGDPVLAGYQENTVAYLIRHALTDNDPLTPPKSPEPVELAKRKIDGLTLAMFGSEVIRNREMTIQHVPGPDAGPRSTAATPTRDTPSAEPPRDDNDSRHHQRHGQGGPPARPPGPRKRGEKRTSRRRIH